MKIIQKTLRLPLFFFCLAGLLVTITNVKPEGGKMTDQAQKVDYYAVLGVERDAFDWEIRKAYYELAKKNHTDKNSDEGAKERTQELNSAKDILCDKEKRRLYDLGLLKNSSVSEVLTQEEQEALESEFENRQSIVQTVLEDCTQKFKKSDECGKGYAKAITALREIKVCKQQLTRTRNEKEQAKARHQLGVALAKLEEIHEQFPNITMEHVNSCVKNDDGTLPNTADLCEKNVSRKILPERARGVLRQYFTSEFKKNSDKNAGPQQPSEDAQKLYDAKNQAEIDALGFSEEKIKKLKQERLEYCDAMKQYNKQSSSLVRSFLDIHDPEKKEKRKKLLQELVESTQNRWKRRAYGTAVLGGITLATYLANRYLNHRKEKRIEELEKQILRLRNAQEIPEEVEEEIRARYRQRYQEIHNDTSLLKWILGGLAVSGAGITLMRMA